MKWYNPLMKTEYEILSIIAKQLQETIDSMEQYSDYHAVICTERIFLDDYAPKVADYIARINAVQNGDAYDINSMPDGYEKPIEMPYQHTIFFILNMGQGQINFAVWNCPVTMQVVSEENSLEAGRDIITEFMKRVNFRFEQGIVQSYFTPAVSNTQQEMYAGFRGLMSVRGFVRCPEDGIVFITNVKVSVKDENGTASRYFDFPFVNINYDSSSIPDPQAYSGRYGSTDAENRSTTQSVSVSTYLWNQEIEDPHENIADMTDAELQNLFSRQIINSWSDMSRRYKLKIVTNIESGGDYMPLYEGYFIWVRTSYVQDWGDVSVWSLSFSKAKESI